MKTILLDVGGTFIKRADGRQTPIPSDGSEAAIAAALVQAIGPLEKVSGIGVAIPGPFDYRQGIFLMQHKFAAVYGKRFRTLAGIPDSIPLRFHHDVNALLLGAIKMLSLEQENTALVTLGTGLGFSYALHGAVQYSPSGSPARSLWNLPMPEGGILEDCVSGRGICAAYARKTGTVPDNAYAVAQKAFSGDQAALEVYSDVGMHLGEALHEAMRDLGIGTVLVGGQIAKSISLMQTSMQPCLEGIRIQQAPYGAVFEGLATLFEKKKPNKA